MDPLVKSHQEKYPVYFREITLDNSNPASFINSITTPLPLLITAWLLDMIDSCSIEKLPIYSSVTHFLFFRFRGRLEDTSICCSHNKAYVEFIRSNKPVTTSFVDRSTHPVYLIVLPLWIRELLRAEVAVLAHETGVLYR